MREIEKDRKRQTNRDRYGEKERVRTGYSNKTKT